MSKIETPTISLAAAIGRRRAVRNYLPMPIHRDVLQKVIDAAIQAPSSMNRQPWSFTVISNRPLLEQCDSRAKAYALAQQSRDDAHPELRRFLATPEFHLFYQAPVLVIISATEPDPMAEQDCCLAAATLMLAAAGEGLGSCWIGLAEAWLNLTETKGELEIPLDHHPVAPIILGYPREWPSAPPRHPPHVTWFIGREEVEK